MSEPTCEQRIDEHKANRLAYIKLLSGPNAAEIAYELGLEDEDDIEQAAYDALIELPLCVETFRTVKVTIGIGGPGDWFEARLDEDGEITRIDYHFNDWFDHAERTLEGEDFDIAQGFCERFISCF